MYYILIGTHPDHTIDQSNICFRNLPGLAGRITNYLRESFNRQAKI
jgi:hypothetical protein